MSEQANNSVIALDRAHEDAEDAVKEISVIGKPVITSSSVERVIQLAFERNAMFGHNAKQDAKQIHVKNSGGKVTLQGNVRNYAEIDEADRIVWDTPGVSGVDNQLTVESS